jgi:uncharacterized protein (TIGR02058 family)
MGMGVDVHGKDSTKAAKRAVSDAIRHSSLGFFRLVGKTGKDMLVDVTIGVPDPASVDTAAVAKELPYGTVDCPWTCSRRKASSMSHLAKTISPGLLNRFSFLTSSFC